MSGYFEGTATFDSWGTLSSAGNDDIFVMRVDDSGFVYWAIKAGGSGDDDAVALANDGTGGDIVAGAQKNTAAFGPSISLQASGESIDWL